MSRVLAARYYEAHKPLKLEQVELPSTGNDDVLIEIKAAGICHSDLHTINGLFPPAKPPPIILGHELSGIVAEKGKNVKKVEVGDRVGADYVLSCGVCSYCVAGKDNLCDNFKAMAVNTDGAWTEKIVVPQRHVHKLPFNIGFPEGAIMNCAVMTSYHAMKLAEVSAGNSVLVYGLGGVGINAIQWARIFGATEIIGVDMEEGKLKLARQMGATATVNPKEGDPVEKIRDITNGGVDVGFEVIGLVDTVKNMIRSVKKGGKAVMVGMCFDNVPISPVNDVMVSEIKIMSPQYHLKAEIPEVLKFIEKGQFDLSHAVSHRLPLKDVNEGVRILNERIGNPVRVVLEP